MTRKSRGTSRRIVSVLVATHLLAFAAGYYAFRPPTVPAPVSSSPTPAPPSATDDPHAELTHDNCLIEFNEARLASGQKQVSNDLNLGKYAQQHAEDMVSGKTPAGHAEFDEWVSAGKFSGYVQVGELVSDGDPSCTHAVQGLLGSPTHRDVMLSPKVNGVGVGTAGTYLVFITSFASPF